MILQSILKGLISNLQSCDKPTACSSQHMLWHMGNSNSPSILGQTHRPSGVLSRCDSSTTAFLGFTKSSVSIGSLLASGKCCMFPLDCRMILALSGRFSRNASQRFCIEENLEGCQNPFVEFSVVCLLLSLSFLRTSTCRLLSMQLSLSRSVLDNNHSGRA